MSQQTPPGSPRTPMGSPRTPVRSPSIPAGSPRTPSGTPQTSAGSSSIPAGSHNTPTRSRSRSSGTHRTPVRSPRTPATSPSIQAGSPHTMGAPQSRSSEPPRTPVRSPRTPATSPSIQAGSPHAMGTPRSRSAESPRTPVRSPRAPATSPSIQPGSPHAMGTPRSRSAESPRTPVRSPRTPAKPAGSPQTTSGSPQTTSGFPRQTTSGSPQTTSGSPQMQFVPAQTPDRGPSTPAAATSTPEPMPYSEYKNITMYPFDISSPFKYHTPPSQYSQRTWPSVGGTPPGTPPGAPPTGQRLSPIPIGIAASSPNPEEDGESFDLPHLEYTSDDVWSVTNELAPHYNESELQRRNETPPAERFRSMFTRPYGRPDYNIVHQVLNRQIGIQKWLEYEKGTTTPTATTPQSPMLPGPMYRARFATPPRSDSPYQIPFLAQNFGFHSTQTRAFLQPRGTKLYQGSERPTPFIEITADNYQYQDYHNAFPGFRPINMSTRNRLTTPPVQRASSPPTADSNQTATSQTTPENLGSPTLRTQQGNIDPASRPFSDQLEEFVKHMRGQKSATPKQGFGSQLPTYQGISPTRSSPRELPEITISGFQKVTERLPSVHNTLCNQPTSNSLRTINERYLTSRTVPDETGATGDWEEVGQRHREVQQILEGNLRSQGRSVTLSIDEALEMFTEAAKSCLEIACRTRSLHPVKDVTQVRALAFQAYKMDIAQAIPPQPFSLPRVYREECFHCKGAVHQINAFYMKSGHVYCMACILEKHYNSPLLVCDSGMTHGVSFALLALYGLYENGRLIRPAVIDWQANENLMYFAWRRIQYYNDVQCEIDGFDMYYSTT